MADGSSNVPHFNGDDTSAGRPLDRTHSIQEKARFAMFATVAGMAIAATIITVTGHLSWTWIFPAPPAFCSIYGYLRVRSAKTSAQRSVWILVEVLCSLGAFALLVIPASM